MENVHHAALKLSNPAAASKCLLCYYPCAAVLTTCSTCEYRDACEWREKKAKEAQEKYVAHELRKKEGTGSFDAI